MNRDVINNLISEFEHTRDLFASGQLDRPKFDEACRSINARLNVYGLALASVAVTPPF